MVMSKEGERGEMRQRAMSEDSDSFTEVACLTVYPLGIFEHSDDKAKLAKQAMLSRAIQSDVGLGQTPDRINIVHRLDHRICVRVQDVRLQSTVRRLVVEPTLRVSATPGLVWAVYTQNRSLLHQTWSIRFQLFGKRGGFLQFHRRGSLPHRAGKFKVEQSPNVHDDNREYTRIRFLTAPEPCTAILFDVSDHIPPTPQLLWYGGVGNVLVQLHCTENLGRYHFWRRKVFWTVGNESLGPRGQ
jgi:hypothetical protein